MAHTISHTNLKIGQVNRQIYQVPDLHDPRLWSHPSSETLSCHYHPFLGRVGRNFRKFIHKDRPRNVGCIHHMYTTSTAVQ